MNEMGPIPQCEEDRDKPGHHDEDIEDSEHPDVIINADSDTDNDDDVDIDGEGGYVEYQALPQNIDAADSDSDSDSSEETQFDAFQQYEGLQNSDENVPGATTDSDNIQVPDGLLHQVRHPNYPNVDNLPGYMQVPDLPRPEKQELLWNQPRHSDLSIDKGHVDKIKSVMSGVHLPSSNIPDWAKNLSEDQWNTQVVNKLRYTGTRFVSGQEVGDRSGDSSTSPKQEVNCEHSNSSQKQSEI